MDLKDFRQGIDRVISIVLPFLQDELNRRDTRHVLKVSHPGSRCVHRLPCPI